MAKKKPNKKQKIIMEPKNKNGISLIGMIMIQKVRNKEIMIKEININTEVFIFSVNFG